MESELGAAILGARVRDEEMEIDLEVSNPQSCPVHVSDIEIVFEQAGREDGEAATNVTRVPHSCIVEPHSSRLVKVPSLSLARSASPYAVRASLSMKDAVRGAYTIRTDRLRHVFRGGGGGAADPERPGKVVSMSHLDGQIESVHFATYAGKEATVGFDFEVKNSNFLPLKLLHVSYTVFHDGKAVLENQIVEKKASIGAKSTAKIRVLIRIPLSKIENGDNIILPVTIAMEFWFKEPFYGIYRIETKKSGDLIFPLEPRLQPQRIAFSRDKQARPIAMLELLVANDNPFVLSLKKVIYHVFSKDTGSNVVKAVYKCDDHEPLLVPAGGQAVVNATAVASSHTFGSALWDIFKGMGSLEERYLLSRRVEAETPYGKVVFE